MFKKIFGKKTLSKEEFIVAPLTGEIRQLEEVPDPVFSQKMMGEGIAIEPTEGIVVAPFNGKVIQVFPTKHALGLKSESGLEVLIHIGLETVSLQGEGFKTYVKEGDRIKKGDMLVTFDRDIIKEKAASTITPIIMTKGEDVESFKVNNESSVIKGETTLIQVHLK